MLQSHWPHLKGSAATCGKAATLDSTALDLPCHLTPHHHMSVVQREVLELSLCDIRADLWWWLGSFWFMFHVKTSCGVMGISGRCSSVEMKHCLLFWAPSCLPSTVGGCSQAGWLAGLLWLCYKEGDFQKDSERQTPEEKFHRWNVRLKPMGDKGEAWRSSLLWEPHPYSGRKHCDVVKAGRKKEHL